VIERVLVVLPTYNERQSLEAVVAGVRAHGHEVLVVDDASPDGTGELADRLSAADPCVSVLHRSGKLGLGSAYTTGFAWGLEHDFEFLVEMDADGSHLPEHLDPIIEAAHDSGGMAIGSRYIPGGAVVGWGASRWLLSWAANLYTRLVLGLRIHDCTSGFRCYKASVVAAIGLDRVVSQGYSFQIEMVYRCARLGFPIREVPIRFEDRVLGRSKVSEGEVRKAILNVLRLRFAPWP
jgi:glycosyltransferase involved in cell wall biosynthesis